MFGEVGPLTDDASVVDEKGLFDQIRGSGAAVIRWEELSRGSELLGLADELDIPLVVVFDHITTDIVTDLVLRHPSIKLPIDASREEFGEYSIRPALRRNWFVAPDGSVPIGSLFPLVGKDRPDLFNEIYEGQRTLSLVSESAVGLLHSIRNAVAQMKRAVVHPLWHPWDEGASVAREVAGERVLNRTGLPNLRDFFQAPNDPVTRESLPVTPRDPSWAVPPPKLLITGESGTGKTLVMRLIHDFLWRDTPGVAAKAPHVPVNLGGRQVENLDHELFGAARDHYTGAWGPGLLARAACGTVFFDEIGDLPLEAQARLLDFLDHLMVRPAGMQPFFAHSHVIAATNRDLRSMIARSEFRHDLRARFSMTVEVPPLRARGQTEVRRLVDFVAQNPTINPLDDDGFDVTHFSAEALDQLAMHEYRDGNFRELEEAVRSAVGAARESRSRAVLPEHIALQPSRHQPEADRRTFEVGEPDHSGEARSFSMASDDDLVRLAALIGRPVLRRDGSSVVIDGMVEFRFP